MNNDDDIVNLGLSIIKIACFLLVSLYIAGWYIYFEKQAIASYNPNKQPKIEDVYKLIKYHYNPITVVKLHSLLYLYWKDPEGKKLLSEMVRQKVPIQITNFESSCSGRSSQNFCQAFLNVQTGAINHAFNSKRGFKNDLYKFNQLEAMGVFIHEICHCITACKGNRGNSKEEEMGASLIGINLSSRIIRGRNLNEQEIEQYSKKYAQWINRGLHHGYLSSTNNFCDDMNSLYGIQVPNEYKLKNYYNYYEKMH